MNNNDYLKQVLASQTFAEKDPELQALRKKREEVEGVLRKEFSTCNPTIKYGGSYAKHTMIKSHYDLDLVCFFDKRNEDAGKNLESIYNNTKDALAKYYIVDPHTSSLRIEENRGTQNIYTHIDVVPGRFVDDNHEDVFLYQNGADECRLKTNTKTHVLYIRDSGLTAPIRLIKLWRHNFGKIPFKTFVLELSVIEVLKTKRNCSLEEQLIAYLCVLRDDFDNIYVEDPANPTGNLLMPYLKDNKTSLTLAADTTLRTLERNGWQEIFGSTENSDKTNSLIQLIPSIRQQGTKPWGI